MKNSRFYFYVSLVVMLFTMILLIKGSFLLTMALNDNSTIPLGTFISWIGLISIPSTLYWGNAQFRKPSGIVNTALAWCLKTILILAILWLPISSLLAGNLSFSFHETESFQGSPMAMNLFWGLSFGIVLGTVFILISYWISLLFKSKFNMN